MLPLDQLKETVVAQYGDDARLILDSIDEVEAILLRRQARAKVNLMMQRPSSICRDFEKDESAGMKLML